VTHRTGMVGVATGPGAAAMGQQMARKAEVPRPVKVAAVRRVAERTEFVVATGLRAAATE